MHILIFSWRDINHPYGGGAELLSHEMSKRWVAQGHPVTHFSASFPGSKSNELIDGVRYLRAGDWYNVHILAFLKILVGQFGNFDVLIDEVHGIPFFSSLYTRKPIVCLACEVAKEVWDQMYPFPLNIVGKICEKIYLSLYKNVKFLTISESTAEDLIQNGMLEKNITILPMGFTYTLPQKLPFKTKHPSVIFLGRLARSKGVADAIKAFSIIQEKIPLAKMRIVGKGAPEYETRLKNLVSRLKLKNSLKFIGFASEPEKFKLLSQAHLILVPSVREGWGLVVPEANLVGTPAIVYNVPGLRDVTKDGVNGQVVTKNTPQGLAQASIKLLLNPVRYQKMSQSSKEYAKSMNWDDTARVALKVLQESL